MIGKVGEVRMADFPNRLGNWSRLGAGSKLASIYRAKKNTGKADAALKFNTLTGNLRRERPVTDRQSSAPSRRRG